MTDYVLLQRYQAERSEPAFSALVQRHVDLVYSTALRHVGSSERAKNVSETVFLELAHSAARLPAGMHLASWLFETTRRRSLDVLSASHAGPPREPTPATAENTLVHSEDSIWQLVRPVLDEVLCDLTDDEREAVIRRFLQHQHLRDIGLALGIAEDAALKRVGAALDRLRVLLEKRRVMTTSVMLGSVLATHAVESTPTAIVTSISRTIAASVDTMLRTSIVGAVVAAIGRTALLVAAVAATGAFLCLYPLRRMQLAEIAEWREQRTQLEQANRDARVRRRTETVASQAHVVSEPPPVDPTEAKVQVLAHRILRLQDWLTRFPEDGSPQMSLLTDADWIVVADQFDDLDNYDANQTAQIAQLNAVQGALAKLDQIASFHFRPALTEAMRAYRHATGNATPAELRDLLPFFSKPVDASFLKGYSLMPVRDGTTQVPAVYYQRSNASWSFSL